MLMVGGEFILWVEIVVGNWYVVKLEFGFVVGG